MNDARLKRIEDKLDVVSKLLAAHVLERELTTPKLEQIYALSGEVGAEEIARRLRVSRGTVAATQERWERVGLLRKKGGGVGKTI